MKIRKGFVSNSSSSSFLIYGAKVDGAPDTNAILRLLLSHQNHENIKELFTELYQKEKSRNPDLAAANGDFGIMVTNYADCYGGISVLEVIDWITKDMIGLSFYDVFGSTFVGVSPYNGEDNETFAEFKERARYMIKMLYPNAEIDWQERAWMDY